MTPLRVLVLGGYGFFGRRISERLARDPRFEVIIAGRDPAQAQALAQTLPRARALQLDHAAADLSQQLVASRAQLLIHSAGPFQGSDTRVAQACIAARIHYVDLADGRDFVCGITQLDAAAHAAGVLVVSGASTVPTMAAAVLADAASDFAEMQEVEIGISPGNRTERGLATIRAILSYCGKPLCLRRDGQWTIVHGWLGLQRHRYPFGSRWLSYCDVPDLQLLPKRYPQLHSVTFRAGLELSLLHLGLWSLSWLVRLGLIHDLARHAALLKRISEWFLGFGSDAGGMHVCLRGRGHDGKRKSRTWVLSASHGDGPQIPCMPAVVLASKLADGWVGKTGAQPCLGLISLEDLRRAWSEFHISELWE